MKPNFMTVRYEWNDTIKFEINPQKDEYIEYYTIYWDEQMVKIFFSHKSNLHELIDSV